MQLKKHNNEIQHHCGKLCKSDCDLKMLFKEREFAKLVKYKSFRKLFLEYNENTESTFIPPKLNPKAGIKSTKTIAE